MKIALVHDHLTNRAGGERVLLAFHRAFPEAPIYTLAYNPDTTFPEFRECDIIPSWFQKISNREEEVKKLFFPLGIMSMRLRYIKGYDIILTTGTHCSKYVKVPKSTKVFSYCFTPFRLAWDPLSYSEVANSNIIKGILYKLIIKVLRKIDFSFSQRTDYFLAMTEETKLRLKNAYLPTNEIAVFNPPLNDHEKYYITEGPKEYYLIVSRLEFYKKVDLVVKVFNKLDRPLIIVGSGGKENELKQICTSDKIQFLKGVSDEELLGLYSNCKAFIYPQHEDYGLTALEANASGRPVIALKKGGVLDTQIDIEQDRKRGTAVFFEEQSVESLEQAILTFEDKEGLFSPIEIQRNAYRFKTEDFINNVKDYIYEKINL